jgi:hypothetical protein
MICRLDSNPIQYERNRWFTYLVHSVDGNVHAEKLPCVGLRLNASKPESMLENGDRLLS